MNRNDQIATSIRGVFQQKDYIADVPEDHDFFDYGLSSLAVIEMQILIEESLKVTVPTSDLMSHPTITDWITIYSQAAVASNGATEVRMSNS